MGKCGAFMLQNLVTMVKRRRAKGSPLYRGEPSKEQDRKFWVLGLDLGLDLENFLNLDWGGGQQVQQD